jgi:hypothetical protein
MFPLVLCSMLVGTVPISILGSEFAMAQRPFWQPDQYGASCSRSRPSCLRRVRRRRRHWHSDANGAVPILGMILGNAISAIGVGINTVSRELSENKDKVEMYLAMGASRFEALKPVVVEALKLALLPTVNQMSVIGLISIPGECGACEGGSCRDDDGRDRRGQVGRAGR